jgi:hypothetical protein
LLRGRVGDLPAVAVLQLKLSPDGSTLYAATHGRGIYSIKVRGCDVYGTTFTCRVKATRAAPATSGAFAFAVTSAVPPRVPAHRSEAWPVPSASIFHPDARTKTGAELLTAVHLLSSIRGLSTRDTTVPGRTHSSCTGASPGATVTSARPAAQLLAADEGVAADAEGLSPVRLEDEAPVVAGPEVGVGVLADGPVERFPDAPPAADPPLVDPSHAARTTIPATTHATAHHRMCVPPGRSYDNQHAPAVAHGPTELWCARHRPGRTGELSR